MPWIKEIEQSNAEGRLKEVFDEISSKRGKLSNIMKVHSLNPDAMKNHMDLYLSIMFNQSGITREEKELIAVVVSTANNCKYCVVHHGEALNHYWKDEDKLMQFIDDYKSIDMPVRTLAMLKYAEKLSLTPNLISEDDINNLHIHDLTDEDILNLNLICSYFNFVNRIVLGLGVEFSEEEMKGYKY